MSINTMRHNPIFYNASFTEDIAVVGVGGLGSEVVRGLVKLGCGEKNKILVFDHDVVEPHNIANQAYDTRHLGMKKVSALASLAREWSGVTLHEHPVAIEGPYALSGVVFVCVDSMAARKIIWESCIKRNQKISLMVETRIEATSAFIHAVDPNNETHIKKWGQYWYPDAEAINGAGCGGHIAVGPTVSAAASFALWQFIRHVAIRRGEKDVMDNQIQMKLRPFSVVAIQW